MQPSKQLKINCYDQHVLIMSCTIATQREDVFMVCLRYTLQIDPTSPSLAINIDMGITIEVQKDASVVLVPLSLQLRVISTTTKIRRRKKDMVVLESSTYHF